MSDKQFTNFKAFWPFYVGEHTHKLNRNLHFLGTALALLFIFEAIVQRDWHLLFFAPIAGYGFSWLGHFFVEKNRPATWRYPLWSLRGDAKMFYFMCTMRMDREVSRMKVLSIDITPPHPSLYP